LTNVKTGITIKELKISSIKRYRNQTGDMLLTDRQKDKQRETDRKHNSLQLSRRI